MTKKPPKPKTPKSPNDAQKLDAPGPKDPSPPPQPEDVDPAEDTAPDPAAPDPEQVEQVEPDAPGPAETGTASAEPDPDAAATTGTADAETPSAEPAPAAGTANGESPATATGTVDAESPSTGAGTAATKDSVTTGTTNTQTTAATTEESAAAGSAETPTAATEDSAAAGTSSAKTLAAEAGTAATTASAESPAAEAGAGEGSATAVAGAGEDEGSAAGAGTVGTAVAAASSTATTGGGKPKARSKSRPKPKSSAPGPTAKTNDAPPPVSAEPDKSDVADPDDLADVENVAASDQAPAEGTATDEVVVEDEASAETEAEVVGEDTAKDSAAPTTTVEEDEESSGGEAVVAVPEDTESDEVAAATTTVEEETKPAGGEDEDTAAAGRRRGRISRRGRIALVGAGTVVALLVGAWAVDSATSSDQVARNVEIAGEAVGGMSETEVQSVVAELGVAQSQRPVSIDTGDKVYETTAAALGLSVDQPATVDALLDAGSDGNPLLRPLSWLASFVRPRDVSLRYAVDEAQATANLEALQGADRTAPVEPTMPLGEAGFSMVPGQNGQGIDPATFPELLLEAAEESADGRIEIDAEVTTLEPAYTDEEVQLLAEQANNITAAGLTVKAGPVEVAVPPAQLRTWIDLAPTDGSLDIAINDAAVNGSLPALVGVVGATPVNASVTLNEAGVPVVVPGLNGVACCGEDSGARIWDALTTSQPQVELVVREAQPDWTTEEVQGWGITQPIGGSRAWRNGGEVPGPAPGFTTYHDCCASRVRNIQRLADMIRGAVVPPGGDFSINDYAGPRTAAKGFVLAGAIAQGQHVDEIGGGVSQFATTMFNAAYFAGLDITEYQAHTEYFSRYPRGREATMGYPRPDLAIHNNTPYGLLIWTSYTDTSLTVTFYSTPWASAEQTGISEGRHGGCRTVVTTRTRWFPDGTTADDTFKATYRPGAGQFC